MPQNRNILFIVIDQLRADCLTGALSEHVDLPNLRRFMKEGVTFKQHFSVTSPCGPSRASLLTGQYAMNHRSVRNGTPLRHDTPNLATELRKSGYLPMLFGYTDTAVDPRVYPADDPALKCVEYVMPGFHEMLEMRFEKSYPWLSHLAAQGYQFETRNDLYTPTSPVGRVPKLNDPALYKAQDSDTAFLTDAFLANSATRQQGNWFTHLTYIRPHPPLVAPAPYNTLYQPAELPLPKRLQTRALEEQVHPFFGPMLRHTTPEKFVHGFPDLDQSDETVQTLRAIYLGLATEVDHHIGRVISDLKSKGQYDDTLIIITADHGEMLGDRHAWGKMTVYEAAYNTPLIIKMPENDARAGQEVVAPTESIDITPTILDWIGREVPSSMDGRSLLPLLKGSLPSDWRSATFSELDFGDPVNPTLWQTMLGTTLRESCLGILRDGRFTLVEFAADLPPLLFDHQANGEEENVAMQEEYASDLARMSRQMLRFRMQHTDQMLSSAAITLDGVKWHRAH